MMEAISIADKGPFEQCRDQLYRGLGSVNHISDLCFANLLTWSDSLQTRRVFRDGFCCIALEFHGQWQHYAPIGQPDAYEALLERAFPGDDVELIMVPEALLPTLERLQNYRVSYSHDVAYSDYIYENDAFLHLLDNPSRRYDYRHFLRHRSPSFHIITESNKADCLHIMDKHWCQRHDCGACHFGCEKKALHKALTHFNALGLSGALVYAGHEPLAFVIAKHLNPGLIAYHFMKTDSSVRGLSYFLLHSFAHAAHKDVQHINFSEDMGREGLRYFKQHLAPYSQVHKYNVMLIRHPAMSLCGAP